jgi:hypothetical protein
MAAEYAAPQADSESASTLRAPGLSARLSPWAWLVAASAAVLATAAIAMTTLWLATARERSSTYAVSAALLRIEIEVERGDVEILGGGREDVQVRRTDHSAFGVDPEEQRTVRWGVLHISSACPSLVVGSCTSDYRVTVPENIPVTIISGDGKVRLLSYRGSAYVTARGGSIAVDAFCGHVLQATSRSGDIDIAAACSPERLELRTDSGDVRAAVPPGRYTVDADAIGGQVAVEGLIRADDAPWTIQALSNSGNVEIEASS